MTEARREPPRSGSTASGDPIDRILDRLRGEPRWRERIVHWHEQPEREAITAPFPERMHPELVEVLRSRGVDALRSHQAEAIEAALAGEDVLVATPTASGKTVCYTVPVLQRLLESNGEARALFLNPTKALSQDQTAGLTAMVEALAVGVEAANETAPD